MSSADEKKFKHYRVGVNESGTSIVYHQKPLPDTPSPSGIRARVLLVPVENDQGDIVDGEYTALSTMLFEDTPQISDNRAAKDIYANCIQDASQVPAALKSNNESTQKKYHRRRQNHNTNGGRSNAYLRNNRVGGAGGNANGLSTELVKLTQASPHVVGAEPRDAHSCVQTAVQERTNGLVTKLPLFYSAASQKNKGKFTTSPNCSPVIKSCESKGIDVLDQVLEVSSSQKDHVRSLLCRFAVSKVTAGILLEALEENEAIKKAGIRRISVEAKANTINCYDETVNFIENGCSLSPVAATAAAASNSIEQEVSSLPPYKRNEDIYYQLNENERDNGASWLMGKIKRLVETKSNDERIYEVIPHDNTNTIQLSEYLISGIPGTGQWDDNDYVEEKVAGNDLLVIKQLFEDGVTQHAIELLSTRGQFNVMHSPVGAHVDDFGKTRQPDHRVNATLENAMDNMKGEADPRYSLPVCGTATDISTIPGSLLFIRFGVATIRDSNIELLDAHNTFHCVIDHETPPVRTVPEVTSTETKKRKRERKKAREVEELNKLDKAIRTRGCWMNGKFYPEGYSIIDWDSKYLGNSTTARVFRERRSQTRDGRVTYRHERSAAAARESDRLIQRANQEGTALARAAGEARVNAMR